MGDRRRRGRGDDAAGSPRGGVAGGPEEEVAAAEINRRLPIRPIDLQVLLLLGSGSHHGYGILKGVEEQSGGAVRLEVGSLYRLIGRLEREGLVAAAAPSPEREDARRGRTYSLTELGRQVALAETRRLERVVELAQESLVGGER